MKNRFSSFESYIMTALQEAEQKNFNFTSDMEKAARQLSAFRADSIDKKLVIEELEAKLNAKDLELVELRKKLKQYENK